MRLSDKTVSVHDDQNPISASPSSFFWLTFADTTWRIFVPVALFVGIGLWLDLTSVTKPWLTLTGLIVGFAVAALLIRRQLKRGKT
jgi:hypothetical protein